MRATTPPATTRSAPSASCATWARPSGDVAASVAAAAAPLPAVASLALRSLLTGPPRPVRELARFSQALYLVVDTAGAPMIALLAPGAVAVPGALQLTTALDRWPEAPAMGSVGEGRLSIGGHHIVVHRWWDPIPRLGSTTPQALRERAGRVAHRLDAVGPTVGGSPGRSAGGAVGDAAGGASGPAMSDDNGAGLYAALGRVVTGLGGADDLAAERAADAIIGLGPGLTPSGDDLLAGLLASIPPLQAAIGADADVADAAHRLAVTVARRAEGRTTTVSAELLRHAAAGAVARPVLEFLRALTGRGAIGPATTRLLQVGSSSGRDLAVGILAAVDLLTDARLGPGGALLEPHDVTSGLSGRGTLARRADTPLQPAGCTRHPAGAAHHPTTRTLPRGS